MHDAEVTEVSLTQSQKVDLIRSISTEDELREQLLVPLFREMKYDGVRSTHGPNERGKDIVLIERDALGDLVYTAVIIKCKDINNATNRQKDKETVANILQQISLTLNSGYDCLIQRRRVDFTKVLVITNGRISNTAEQEMVRAAQQSRFVHLSCKRDEDLVAWVDNSLPDFYTYASGEVSSYITKLANECERLDALRNISIYRGEVRRVMDVFVSPTLTSTQKSAAGDAEPVYNRLSEVLTQRRHVLLVGGPGTGKSTLVRAQVQQLIAQNSRGQTLHFPILVRATDLVAIAGDTLEDVLNEFIVRHYGLAAFNLSTKLSQQGAIVYVFVDGLDEVSLETDRTRIKNLLRGFAERHDHHKLIAISRNSSELERWSVPRTRRWDIMPLRPKQIEDFISRWFGDGQKSHPLLRALHDHALLNKLPRTPLVLTLLAILFESNTYVEAPANLSELYLMFVDLLLGRWNMGRSVETMFEANIKEFVLTKVAEELHLRGQVAMIPPAFMRVVDECSVHLGVPLNSELLLTELVDTSGLLILNEKGDVEFRHHSFQEFMVAKLHLSRPSEHSEPYLLGRFDNQWWSNVIYYFCGLRKQNDVLLPKLAEALDGYDTLRSLKAVHDLGYLIQSSYLTSISVRKQCLEQALRSHSRIFRKIMSMEGDATLDAHKSPGMLAIMLAQVFKMFYSSRFMMPLYRQVMDSLLGTSLASFEQKLEALLIASLLSDAGDPSALHSVYDKLAQEPLLNLVLQFQVNIQLQSGDISKDNRRFMNRLSDKLKTRMREGREAYELLLNPRKSIRDAAPAEQDAPTSG